MNLILCELLVVLIGIPADTIAAVQQGWDMGPLVCNVVGFCLTTLGNQSKGLNQKQGAIGYQVVNVCKCSPSKMSKIPKV